MKRMCLTAFISMLFVFKAAFASAAYYTDYYNAHGQYMSLGDYVTWVFDISDEGFNPGIEDIVSAEVTLNLRDDEDLVLEFARLDSSGYQNTWEVDSGEITFQLKALSGLNENGNLEVTLTAVNYYAFGLFTDFYFNSATLNAQSNGGVPAPEPSTAIMIAAGLILCWGVKKFKIKQTSKSYKI